MTVRQRWNVGFVVAAIAALTSGLVGCGGSSSSSKPAPTTATETAGVAGSWSGTWSEAGVASTFDASINCSGVLSGTLTPSSGGNAEPVTGTVTTWNATTGAFQATITRGGESHTLIGVVNGNDLTGSFTTDAGATGNFVVTLSGNATICTAQQVADLSSGSKVTSELISAVDAATSTCNGTGADPYDGGATTDNVAILLKPNAGGTVDVVMTFAPTDTTAQVGVIGTSADAGSELHFTGVGTTFGTNYLATFDVILTIGGDGSLTGTFAGTVDADGAGDLSGANDCTAIAGTFSGGGLVP